MKKHLDPFTYYLPHLDLHGETIESSNYLINNFLKDNYNLNNNKVIIIHGKSTGILKKATHNLLKKSKLVNKYYVDSQNDGQTIVELKEQ